jgi:hypothetical protein
MKPKDNGNQAIVLEKPADNKQILVVVDGCKVKLNFPAVPESTAVNDIKRMMLGGVAKP